MSIRQIQLSDFGPIRQADVRFGDLTVLVGPQATGKSIFLQVLKLLVDQSAIHDELRRFNIQWNNDATSFFELYFGEGLGDLWTESSVLNVDGVSQDLRRLARSAGRRDKNERLFFIPAQRVLSLKEGLTRPFTDFRSGDPFVVREFSERLHGLVQNEFGRDPALFPKANRLHRSLRGPLIESIFGEYSLAVGTDKFQKRIVLNPPREGGKPLPYLVWSAGQREFVPLLLGLYWLIPPAKVSQRGKLNWVVIEELEMGLHPKAITATLALVLELLKRDYRVCLSTHSPHVLDVVWALQFLKNNGGTPDDVLEIFGLDRAKSMRELAGAALKKTISVQFFQRNGNVRDISGLDPGSDSPEENGWGGLTEFSSHVGDIVSKVARRAQDRDMRKHGGG